MKFASLFTGGDLAGEGARMAGLTPIWGVEYDTDIAANAELNGTSITVSKVEDVDFSALESPDWLHMSPPCINASIAKTDAGEAPEDIAMAQGCIKAIRQFKSPFVSLENVWGYRNFESFQMIYAELSRLNYQIRFWHLCAADYGVAQTRKRLILVASLKGTPKRPTQTHAKEPEDGFFGTMPQWIGWYEAIEDLIPSLPESKFAEWQLARLSLDETALVTNQNDQPSGVPDRKAVSVQSSRPSPPVLASSPGKTKAFLLSKAEISNTARDINPRFESEPAGTIGAGDFRRPSSVPVAFLVHNNYQRTMPTRDGGEPSFTVMGGGNNSHDPGIKPKAFLVDRVNSSSGTVREDSDPAFTQSVYDSQHQPPQAFLMPGGNASSAEPREPREPSQTVGDTERVGNIPRAFIATGTSTMEVRNDDAPASTVCATVHAKAAMPRAWLSQGRVVALTVRALARLQSIPDSYQLPERTSLACRIVGNAVPPLLMQRIIEAQIK